MTTILGLMVFVLAFWGYVLFINERYKIKTEFIPIIIISFTVCIMFLAGLLNILLIAAAAFAIVGLAIIIYEATKSNILIQTRKLLTPGIIFLIISSIVMIIMLKGARLTHYDNFSHWALIVKDMDIYNRLPNFTSGIIQFQNYPPGSALFIYLICKIIGYSEGVMLMAQSFIMLCSFTTFFALSGGAKNYLKNICITLACILMMIIFRDNIYNLLVDALLPIVSVAATAIIIYHKNNIKKAMFLSTPINIFILLIKNSGYLFFAFNITFILYYLIKNKPISKHKDKILFIFLYITTPLIFLLLWNRHVAYVFSSGLVSKHSVNLNSYQSIFNEKSPETIRFIIKEFVKTTISISRNNTMMILLIVTPLVLYIFYKKFYKIKLKYTLLLTLWAVGGSVIYLIGILGTYLFSMPVSEAVLMPSYSRYYETIIIYFTGIILIGILCDLPKANNSIYKALLIGTCVLMCVNIALSDNLVVLYNRSLYYEDNPPFINDLSNFIKTHNVPKSDKYCVYVSTALDDHSQPDISGYYYYAARYTLFTDETKIITYNNLEEMIDKLDNYEYLLVLYEDEKIKSYLSPDFLSAYENTTGVYSTKNLKKVN